MTPRATVPLVIVVVFGFAWVLWPRVPVGEVLTPSVVGSAPSAADEEGNPEHLGGDLTVGDGVVHWEAQRIHQNPSKVAHRSDPDPPRAATRPLDNPISQVNPPSRSALGGGTQHLTTEPPGQTTSKAEQTASQGSSAPSNETPVLQEQVPKGPDTDGVVTAAPAPSRDPVLRSPSFLTGVPPDYPAGGYQIALNRPSLTPRLQVDAAQGRVVLRLLVLPNGTVDRVNVVVSSGFDVLDRAAVSAAGIWRFIPATRDGEPIEAWVVIPVRFVIQ